MLGFRSNRKQPKVPPPRAARREFQGNRPPPSPAPRKTFTTIPDKLDLLYRIEALEARIQALESRPEQTRPEQTAAE